VPISPPLSTSGDPTRGIAFRNSARKLLFLLATHKTARTGRWLQPLAGFVGFNAGSERCKIDYKSTSTGGVNSTGNGGVPTDCRRRRLASGTKKQCTAMLLPLLRPLPPSPPHC
jgi:hypothetical protein